MIFHTGNPMEIRISFVCNKLASEHVAYTRLEYVVRLVRNNGRQSSDDFEAAWMRILAVRERGKTQAKEINLIIIIIYLVLSR